MKQPFIKTLLIVQICLASAANAGSEILRPVKFENREVWRSDSEASITKTIQKQKSDRRKRGIWKHMKENSRDLIIFTIVLLSIGAIIFGGIGLISLIGTLEYLGDSLAFIYFLYAVAGLSLGLLCLIGIIKQIKKLKKGERPMENLPHRPPTQKTNQ